MRAVLMEVVFRVCATPRRALRFSDHAAHIVASELPQRVRRDHFLQQSHSVLLRRQWDRLNGDLLLATPETQEIGFGFHDPAGRLTAAQVESLANSVLADLMSEHSPGTSTDETVPWILTLNAAVDRASRASIAQRYPTLDPRPARIPMAAASGRN